MTAQPITETEEYGDGISALVRQESQGPLLSLVQHDVPPDYNPTLRVVRHEESASESELESKLPEELVAYKRMKDASQSALDKLRLEDPESYIEDLGEMDIVDRQTNLFNKDYFENELVPYMINKAQEEGTTLSVISIDIDHFKAYNDTHGHQAGDDGISYVVSKLDESIRTRDILPGEKPRKKDLRGARVGQGEEFEVLLYGVNEEQAYQIAERIRSSIDNDTIKTDGKELPITASLGVAELQYGESAKDLRGRADHALYAAKEEGRNRVIAFGYSPN